MDCFFCKLKKLSNKKKLLNNIFFIFIFILSLLNHVYASKPVPYSPPIYGELELAIKNNDLDKTNKLISTGMNIEGIMKDGMPLEIAIENGNYEIVKLLIERGAKVNGVKDSFSPLHTASKFSNNNNSIKIIELLLLKGANVNHIFNDHHPTQTVNNTTPIFWAMGNPEAVKLLINANADMNIRDVVGRTLLFYAVNEQDVESVKLLLDSKINQDYRERLLHIVVSENYENYYKSIALQKEIIETLLKAGYDINLPDDSGETPLHEAIWKLSDNELISLVKLLLENGADPNIFDTNPKCYKGYLKTPTHLFASQIYPFRTDENEFYNDLNIEVFELLLQHNADINALTKFNNQTVLDLLYERALEEVEKHNLDINNFEKLNLIKYLRSKGAQFGYELKPISFKPVSTLKFVSYCLR
ncbi:ankyrin repeat domain-containing protein [Gilliamella apicola]|uniref:ankyrin repeat domain-containing protein n=1 Tax=Gilliamella apicola TaxID=1196095 RepID=UPI0009FF167A|nr:ankyrin repeat domain-containing protein [Gilliamella apicola]ORF44219.1 hypothetical protein B5800_12425 [Gilliamella apicola]ORF46369.1 hypothetical protein B5803_12980 [Gilliamella apicola]ORF47495.1 hypothetical protein B5799_12405 [Gilliamella apicola]ORF52378.1 hypothetical protein B5798_11895 [Gilliamella apicola]ORF54631.1 hypothetical protein B5802_07820 [Gilliamella apicola]